MTAPARPSSSLTAGTRVITRPLVEDRPIVAVVALVVLAAALILTAMPRMINRVSGEGFHAVLADTRSSIRSLDLTIVGPHQPGPGSDPLAPIRAAGDLFRTNHLSPALATAFPDSLMMVETPSLKAHPYPGAATPTFPTDLVLRHYDEIDDRISMNTDWPTGAPDGLIAGTGPNCADLPLGEWDDDLFEVDENGLVLCYGTPLPVIEAAFTRVTLDALGLSLGDRLLVQPDVISFRGPGPWLEAAKIVEITGVVTIDHPNDDFWFGDSRLQKPDHTVDSDQNIIAIHAVGLFHASDYPNMFGHFIPFDMVHRFRHQLDPNAITPGSAGALASELRAVQVRRLTGDLTGASVTTGLVPVIDAYLAGLGRAMAVAASSLLAVGLVTLGLVWMLARLLHDRHRDGLILLRSRGGTAAQMAVTQLLQVALFTIPLVALAYLVSEWSLPVPSPVPMILAVGLGVLVPTAYLAASRRSIGTDLGQLLDARRADPVVARRGLVVEVVLMLLAGLSFLLITRRGPAPGGQIDLLAAAAPALLALAGGLLAAHLLSVVVGVGAKLGARLPGATTFMAFRRIRQEAARTKPSFLVLILAIALLGFTFATRMSLLEVQSSAAYQEVGADFRVTGSFTGQRLPPDLGLASVEGVELTTRVALAPAVLARVEGRSREDRVDILGIDGLAHQSVVVGSPADHGLPAFLAVPEGDGSRQSPIPVIVSSEWGAPGPPRIGEMFSVRLGAHTMWFTAAEVRDEFPGIDPGRPFVVVPRSAVSDSGAQAAMSPTQIYVRGAPGALHGIEAAVLSWNPEARVESAQARLDELRQHPMTRVVALGLSVSLGALAVFSILAVVVLVATGQRTRARDTGNLEILGMGSTHITAMATIEVVTTITVAATVGLLLGNVATKLLGDHLGLTEVVSPGVMAITAGVVTFTLIGMTTLRLLTWRRKAVPVSLHGEGDS